MFQNSGIPYEKVGMVPSVGERVESTWLNMVFHYFWGLAYQGQDIVFRFIIEYSNVRDLKSINPQSNPISKKDSTPD